jgi:hypothetical protein
LRLLDSSISAQNDLYTEFISPSFTTSISIGSYNHGILLEAREQHLDGAFCNKETDLARKKIDLDLITANTT